MVWIKRKYEGLKRRITKINYVVDECRQYGPVLTVRGWMCSPAGLLEDVSFVLEDRDRKAYVLKGTYGIDREDVFRQLQIENAKNCGFLAQAMIENLDDYDVYVQYTFRKHTCRVKLGHIQCGTPDKGTDQEKIEKKANVTELEFTGHVVDIIEAMEAEASYTMTFPAELYEETIDIIIPVYNGYRYLEKLLTSVRRTAMKYRLILIDDKSPDERVMPYLQEYAAGDDRVMLLQNEENLGFVQTVNRGFEAAKNHIALVNTDVELPQQWLERLMLPILLDAKVASATPYTNCGTICSFPKYGQDNKLFLDLSLAEIDDEFKKIEPHYEELPSGVGFCMGINRDVLREIGPFDAETFGKGYSEENDWCRRAVESGYYNVQVENLYVFHNHGGSFNSEDKKKYLAENFKKLLIKHPGYDKEIDCFAVHDPNGVIRQLVTFRLLKKYLKGKKILAIEHALGGGAESYLINKKKKCLEDGNAFIILRYEILKNYYSITYEWEDLSLQMQYRSGHDLKRVLEYLSPDEIWINEIATYPDLFEQLESIREVSAQNHVPVRMLFHDYFAVCPTINLINQEDCYCALPDRETCNRCFSSNRSLQVPYCSSIDQWRENWGTFLRSCAEVVVFSESTRDIAEKTFGQLDNLRIIPHEIGYMPHIEKKNKTTGTLNIGLLGVLSKHKGGAIVRALLDLIEEEHLDIRIKLIGSSEKVIDSPLFSQTGPYTRGAIPYLTLENDIDIFLIPSIWPETFSYTTEEIMRMGMPIMCFDIGAPAERVKKYEKGIIIPQILAESVLDTLKKSALYENWTTIPVNREKVLFVVQEVTFSSRYRVDHLREQLLRRGCDSDCVSVREALECNLNAYQAIVIYRVSDADIVRRLKQKAKKLRKPIWYDIDDFIFSYDAIKRLSFLKESEFKNYEAYTEKIRACMNLSDAYIVSTESLKKVTAERFPGKNVLVSRNRASMEMTIASLTAEKPEKRGVTIGYFSGTMSHNADFNSIRDVLLSAMKENQEVHLLVVGQMTLPPQFNDVKDRVETVGFVSWQELPQLIARADINLMPLEDTIFNECKSENKWMEAALVKVVTIASTNKELARVIHDGEDGYLCETKEEWAEKLNKLLQDPSLRERMAEAAHRRVMKEYLTDNLESDVFAELTGKKDEKEDA